MTRRVLPLIIGSLVLLLGCGGDSTGPDFATLAVTTTSLPDAALTVAYSQTLVATGGDGNYTWSVTIGALPTGLSLNVSTGGISGTPTGSSSTFTVRVASGDGQTVTRQFTITVVDFDPLVLQWPVPGQDGADWVINNYVDLDGGPGVRDYRGGAKTYDGHRGIDIDVPNFRWMDNGHPIVAAHAGEVVSLGDGQPDRNTSCIGTWNFVNVRHDDGSTMTYGHLKQNSIVVIIGQQVSAGDALGVVGSSGCSTQPHLHLELRDESGTVVDPFRDELFTDPPVYDAPLDFMDLNLKEGAITGVGELKDPPPNATLVTSGSTIGIGLSMAGGTTGDVIRVLVLDDSNLLVHDRGTTFQQTWRHTYWYWNLSLTTGAPGSWTIEVYTNGALRATYGFTVQ